MKKGIKIRGKGNRENCNQIKMGQYEVYKILERRSDKWLTASEIHRIIKKRKGLAAIRSALRKMYNLREINRKEENTGKKRQFKYKIR